MSLNRRSFLQLSALSTITAAGLSACGSPSSSTSVAVTTPVTGGTLRLGYETEPATLNPQLSSQDTVAPLLRNAFDSYLYRDEEGVYHPWLAESYEVSEDGLNVTLVLKEGVTFSDGSALDADAVLANFDKLAQSDYTATNSVGRSNLTGWAKGEDERTVIFTLSQPDNLFIAYLSALGSTPLSPASLDDGGLKGGGPTIAGTGPFTITAYQQGSSLTFSKREDYNWAPEALTGRNGAAYLDGIEVSFLTEAATRTGALQSGQVDMIYGVPAQNVKGFSTGGFAYEEVLNSGTPYSLYLNVSKSPLEDLRVRQAFQKAVDLDTIITSIYYGTAKRAWSSLSPTSSFYNQELEAGSITYDVDAANALLDEAGWTGRDEEGFRTKDGERLTVRLVSGAIYVRDSRDTLNLAIADAMKKNVGINYVFEPVDSGTETERADANDYEVFDNTYNSPDPALALDLLYNSDPAKGVIARGRYNDTTIDQWLNSARSQTNQEQRAQIYDQFQTYTVTEQAYLLPLYVPRNSLAYSDKVQGTLVDTGSGSIFSAYNISLAG
ncbi:ABC transporter substrate-binding protein [Actinomyces faecalis]|uniref:ABC transporter substrate-binding protein n=1 Tax=Actinomyces faecalis TaxID=2722820 RepID=UPI001553170A|nr:ABC transporter substrate-binding protein [Actinomyces faecalis]